MTFSPKSRFEARIPDVVVFAPFAEIEKHSSIEWIVSNTLSKLSNVTIVRCNKAFNKLCISMRLHRISLSDSEVKKDLVCKECIRKKNAWNNDLKATKLEFVPNDLLNDIDLRNGLRKLKSNFHPNDFIYHGIPLGNIAAYDLIIENKLLDGKIPDSLRDEFELLVMQSWSAFSYANELFENNHYTFLIVFDHLYSINRAFVEAALHNGLKIISIGRRPTRDLLDLFITIDLLDESLDPLNNLYRCW